MWKVPRVPCDQNLLSRQARSQRHCPHLRCTWTLASWVVSLKRQVRSSTSVMSELGQQPQRQYSHSCARCWVNITTLCNVWTTLCVLFIKCEEKNLIYLPCPSLQMCLEACHVRPDLKATSSYEPQTEKYLKISSRDALKADLSTYKKKTLQSCANTHANTPYFVKKPVPSLFLGIRS